MPLTAQSLHDVMGGILPLARYSALLPTYNAAMIAAGCTTTKRASAWHSQLAHESMGLKYMAEIATNDPGWTEDRRIYRGRGPIQLTWSSNYRKFGQWCKTQGLVDDSELFVRTPTLVEDPKWGFLAASWYWLEGGPKAGKINGYADAGDILSVSRCVNGWSTNQDGSIRIPNGYAERQAIWSRSRAMGDAILPNTEGIPYVPSAIELLEARRPAFNEINQIGWDSANPHGSTRSQPPRNWLLHTQEGDGNAETLAQFLRNSSGNGAVSYHYTIAEDRNDHGVTVCDVIDTDLYSWAVLNANVFTINACFAGSRAAQTRQQWLDWYRNAIRVAAYLAVQDALKYPTISTNVIKPPYASTGSGLSDHRWVTKALGIGTHTDVGDGFPWDVFEADVKFFVGVPTTDIPAAPPPVVDTAPLKRFPEDWTDREISVETLRQLRGPSLTGWKQLGGKSMVDAIATLDEIRALEGL